MNDAPAAAPMAVHTRACKAGSGLPLVLFHGGMGSWNHWVRNFDALAERHTVHAVDLPGYGASGSVSKSIPQADYIELVAQGVTGIVGSERFGLAGFSFGGVVAAMTAAHMGKQVSRLSLMGVGGFGGNPPLPMRAIPTESEGAAARRKVFRHNLNVLMLADAASILEETIDLHAYNFEHTRYDGRGFSLSNNVPAALAHIPGPVQFIYGDRDALAGHDLERRAALVRAIHPRVRFDILPGAGHWVQYEAAASVNRLLLEFFED